jgi:hypothetical protein
MYSSIHDGGAPAERFLAFLWSYCSPHSPILLDNSELYTFICNVKEWKYLDPPATLMPTMYVASHRL